MRAGIFLLLIGLLSTPYSAKAGDLHDAARKGDVSAIVAVLAAGADVNEYNGQSTPLNVAVRHGHAEAARLLLAHGADVNAPTDYWGDSLMMAVKNNRIDLVKLLLARSARPNSTHSGETVLHVAAKSGCFGCVKALVEAGADVNAETYEGEICISHRTPLHLATLYNFMDIADYLLAHGAMIPNPAPVNTRLAHADPERGRLLFEKNCRSCHFTEPGSAKHIGPNLWDVVGRAKASLENANYSKSLRTWNGTWTYEDLSTFLYGPMLTRPGVTMEVAGIADEFQRADLIAYLRTLSDTPMDLP